MSLNIIDPLTDLRWSEFVARDTRSSVFHRKEWLQALSRTYGYEPFVLTSATPGEPLSDGVVLCIVSSWITGRRVVSLPFTDHCDPLFGPRLGPTELAEWTRVECKKKKWKYIEFRPSPATAKGEDEVFHRTERYWLHVLDLTHTIEDLHARLHKSSMQRRIKHAERAGLTYEVGNSKELLSGFFSLLLKTRRRHSLVPQPRAWFENLAEAFGDLLQIRMVRKEGIPVAAILTLRHGTKVYYKYGCSDQRHHHLAGMPFLFWKLIGESKSSQATTIDFGRTDSEQQGLVTFKDRLGTVKTSFEYFRHSRTQFPKATGALVVAAITVRNVFAVLPYPVLHVIGRHLYRHIG